IVNEYEKCLGRREDIHKECTAESVQWRLPNGGNWQNSKAATIKNVAVIGGGTMGRGIAISLAQAGYHTTLVENDSETMENCASDRQCTPIYVKEGTSGEGRTCDNKGG
ncbi:hypothetical protein COOONC_10895, partial [Cooperia oncophora]